MSFPFTAKTGACFPIHFATSLGVCLTVEQFEKPLDDEKSFELSHKEYFDDLENKTGPKSSTVCITNK